MSLELFPSNGKFELTHPASGEPTGLVLEMLPPDHDILFNASVEFMKAVRTSKEDSIDLSASLENRIKIVAAAVVGWEVKSEQWVDVLKHLGYHEVTFTKDKLIKLLSMPTAGWIRSQINSFLTEKEAFFKQASSSSLGQ
jgi:hypothetical protein